MNENPCRDILMEHPGAVTIDYQKFVDALKYYMENPEPGLDVYTAACRRATGNPGLVLSFAQRQQVKQVGHATIYGATRGDISAMLKRTLSKSGEGRRSAQFDPNATPTHQPVIHPNLASKNERILKRIIEKVGEGEYKISSRGVPHAVFRDYYSVVRFGSGKLAVFDNHCSFGQPQNRLSFPHWNAVVDYLRDKLT